MPRRCQGASPEGMDVYAHVAIGDVAARDTATLRAAGLTVELNDQFYGFSVDATVMDGQASTKVEWNEANRERFFPVAENDSFGWTLHRADLAIQLARRTCPLLIPAEAGMSGGKRDPR